MLAALVLFSLVVTLVFSPASRRTFPLALRETSFPVTVEEGCKEAYRGAFERYSVGSPYTFKNSAVMSSHIWNAIVRIPRRSS